MHARLFLELRLGVLLSTSLAALSLVSCADVALILHGTADRAVPVEQSRQYEHAANAMGKNVKAVYFEGMGRQVTLMHAGTESPALAEMRRRVQGMARQTAIAFLREHLARETP